MNVKLIWIGDNICFDDAPTVRARSPAGLIDFTLEDALRKIDEFCEYGRRRIETACSVRLEIAAWSAEDLVADRMGRR